MQAPRTIAALFAKVRPRLSLNFVQSGRVEVNHRLAPPFFTKSASSIDKAIFANLGPIVHDSAFSYFMTVPVWDRRFDRPRLRPESTPS